MLELTPPPEGQPSSSEANGLPAVVLPDCASSCVNPALKLKGLTLETGVMLLALITNSSPPTFKVCFRMVVLSVAESE
jgi:hypothetical protein